MPMAGGGPLDNSRLTAVDCFRLIDQMRLRLPETNAQLRSGTLDPDTIPDGSSLTVGEVYALGFALADLLPLPSPHRPGSFNQAELLELANFYAAVKRSEKAAKN